VVRGPLPSNRPAPLLAAGLEGEEGQDCGVEVAAPPRSPCMYALRSSRAASIPGMNNKQLDEEMPAVFTPPRDDPATRPRFAWTPRELDDPGGDHPTRLATRQACALTLMVFCVFGVVIAVVSGMYAVATALLGSQTILHCSEQPIQNGVIWTGVLNSTAQIRCNSGYSLKVPPQLDLRCNLIKQHCVVLRAATVQEKALRNCEREYAYVKSTELIDLNAPNSSNLKTLETEAFRLTAGVCVFDALAQTQRLYGQRKAPLQGNFVGTGIPAWSPAAASASPIALVLVALAALVGSGVARAREGVGHDRVANDPDTAALLDVEETDSCASPSAGATGRAGAGCSSPPWRPPD